MIKKQTLIKETSAVTLGMHILEIEITTRCNLYCRHCYNRRSKVVDMPLLRIRKFYQFANKYNIRSLIISGGEAKLHPYFKKIVNHFKNRSRKFRLVLQTNGTNVDNKVIDYFRSFDLIHISYDPSDGVRKSGNNLSLAQSLIRSGLKCYLFCTIHKDNVNMIDEMVQKCNDAKVPIGFNLCVVTDKMDQDKLLSKKQFMETEIKLYRLFLKKKILRYSSPLVALLDPKKTKFSQRIKGGCSAGVAACLIGSDGEVYPCPFFRVSAGNAFKKSLKQIWLKSKFFSQLRSRKKINSCGKCEYVAYCGGCRKRAMKTGNIFGSDPMCYKDQLK